MAQTERAANQGPAKLRLENFVFVKIWFPENYFSLFITYKFSNFLNKRIISR